MNDTLVAPTIAGLFLLAGGVTVAIIQSRTNKKTSTSERAPDVMEAWHEADKARRRVRLLEDLFYTLRSAFKSYARRMVDLIGDEKASLSISERAALESDTPGEEPNN